MLLTLVKFPPMNEIFAMAKHLDIGQLWADSGCQRGVVRTETHSKLRALYAKYGMCPLRDVSSPQCFQFGDGNSTESVCVWWYPVFNQGKCKGNLPLAEIQGSPCPCLFSATMMDQGKVTMDGNIM